ncbi:MAG TPA: hypothetical protein VHZ97_11835 [Pseudonocardiaceae bacterium]|nr:hypothetical protein [Pseudonocardiaceae bacterium]
MLWHNRAAAAAAGVRYPGYIYAAQAHAAMDLQAQRYRDWWEPLVSGAWQRLVEQVREWPGTSIVSCELLASADDEQAARARRELSFADVHVVCTVRDLARQIPSVWQENIKNGQTIGYSAFRDALRTGEPIGVSQLFWDYQDIPRILRTWGAGLPPERVHVITVPRKGAADVLWRRFAGVLGLDPDLLPPLPTRNSSLSLAGGELLRRLNLALDENLGWSRYAAVVKDQVAAEILAGRGGMTLPVADRGWVRERAERMVAELGGQGYDVLGDLADLLPPPTGPDMPVEPSDAAVLDAAVTALSGLVERVSPVPPDLPGLERVRHRLRALSDTYPTLMTVRRLYWTGKARLRRPGSGGRDWHRLR